MFIKLDEKAKKFIDDKNIKICNINMKTVGCWASIKVIPVVKTGEPKNTENYNIVENDILKVYVSKDVVLKNDEISLTTERFLFSKMLAVKLK